MYDGMDVDGESSGQLFLTLKLYLILEKYMDSKLTLYIDIFSSIRQTTNFLKLTIGLGVALDLKL